MLFPIGDTPNPKRFTPYINYAIIGLNIAIYLAITLPLTFASIDPRDPALHAYLDALGISLTHPTFQRLLASITAYDLFVFEHGFKPGAPSFVDLFASMFLHGGFFHLAGNMLFLWIFGDNVEHHLGRLKYLITYLFAGVIATLTFALIAGGSLVPLVGASGAISGVLGIYFFLFPRNRVKVFVLFFPFLVDVLLLPARWVLGFYVLVDNLVPFLLQSSSNVAYGAHLGGFGAGVLLAFLGERFAWQLPRRPTEETSVCDLESMREAISRCEKKRAVAGVFAIGAKEIDGLEPAHCVQLAEWLQEGGHAIPATTLLRRCLTRRDVAPSRIAEVYLALGLLRLRQGRATAAYQHLLSVLDHDPDPQVERRAHEALETINVYRRTDR